MNRFSYMFYIGILCGFVSVAQANLPTLPTMPACAQRSDFPPTNLGVNTNADAKAKALNAAADSCTGADREKVKGYANACQLAKGNKAEGDMRKKCDLNYTALYQNAHWCGYIPEVSGKIAADQTSSEKFQALQDKYVSTYDACSTGIHSAMYDAMDVCNTFNGDAAVCNRGYSALGQTCIPNVVKIGTASYRFTTGCYSPPSNWGPVKVGQGPP